MKLTYRWNHYEDVEQEAFTAYLHEMAQKGWLLTNAGNYLLSFTRISPSDIQFCSDFYTGKRFMLAPVETDEGMQDYLQLCKDSGWSYVCPHGHCLIFKSEVDDHPYPLSSDEGLSKRSLFRKTIVLRLLLLVTTLFASYILIAHPESQLTHYLSLEVPLEFLIGAVFFPSIALRTMRYFILLYRYLRPSPKHRLYQRAASICSYVYDILQSIFWLVAIPIACVNMFTIHSPYFTIFSIYVLFGVLLFLCILGRDILSHVSKKKSKRIGKSILVLGLLIICSIAIANVNQPTSLSQDRPTGTLWIEQEGIRGGEYRHYRTISFYVKSGDVSDIRQRIPIDTKDENVHSYREERLYSAIYHAWDKDKASTIMDVYLRQEVASHQQYGKDFIDLGIDRAFNLITRQEALTMVRTLDAQDWGIDEGYAFYMNECIIRKGSTIAYYLYEGENEDFSASLKKAIQEL